MYPFIIRNQMGCEIKYTPSEKDDILFFTTFISHFVRLNTKNCSRFLKTFLNMPKSML